MTPEQWDIVVVPFPFTDGPGTKRRPAVVLSPADFNQQAGHSILAMITSAKGSSWPGDIHLDPVPLGLNQACVIRMKFFTIDNRLMLKRISKVGREEQFPLRRFIERLCEIRDAE